MQIILGITGSIAAIKAPEIAREFVRGGVSVTTAVTAGGLRFTTAEAMNAITTNRTISEIFHADLDGTWHIHAARAADAMLIAPCSASTIGYLAGGIYNNPVTLLASSLPRTTPLFLAPAMDEEMWLQPAVQRNLALLREQGIHILGPISGPLASGLSGMGRMLEPSEIVHRVLSHLGVAGKVGHAALNPSQRSADLSRDHVLITGGPTYEPIDPVRFIGNRSSGKMAAALAKKSAAMGADVTLIMGPSPVSTNGNIRRINIETADEMLRAVHDELEDATIIIMNAAVADFAPASASDSKIKKRQTPQGEEMHLALRRTPDILSEIVKNKRAGQFIIGFALETGDQALEYALDKMKEKSLDMIVLNRADEIGAGFGGDTNKITIITPNGHRQEHPIVTKDQCAEIILEAAVKFRTSSERTT